MKLVRVDGCVVVLEDRSMDASTNAEKGKKLAACAAVSRVQVDVIILLNY